MTRDAEHTPYPQSVVVPVGGGYDAVDVRYGLHLIANEDCDEVAASYYAKKALAHLAAPAPSSLAGGEVVMTVQALTIAACKGEQEHFEAWAKSKRYDMSEHPLHYIFNDPKTDAARMGWNAALAYVREAALSPEAPARIETPIDALCTALTPRHEAPAREVVDVLQAYADEVARIPVTDETSGDDAYNVLSVVVDYARELSQARPDPDDTSGDLHGRIFRNPRALTPRHEAPAEPCKSCNGTGRELGSAFNRCSDCEALAEGAGERVKGASELQAELDQLANEYGDLLTEVEALRARSSAPEAREGAAVAVSAKDMAEMTAFANNHGTVEDWAVWCRIRAALTTHPAAPSADKLREVTPELAAEFANIDGPWTRGQMEMDEVWSRLIDAQLDALKAEGA